MRSLIICSFLILVGQAFAQVAAPTAEQMVEQLTSSQKPQRTRSLRNLTVEAAQVRTGSESGMDERPPELAIEKGPQAAAVRPSLSLSIQFDFDSFRIRPESQVVLDHLATALASPALQAFPFLIEGHTDAKGAAEYNRKISAQRAQAVKDLLVAKGIEGARLQTVGKGSSELVDANAPMGAENRRVKIVNLD